MAPLVRNPARRTRRALLALAATAAFASAAMPPAALAQAERIDPAAERMLRASTSYVAGLMRFSLDARSTTEVVLKSGQRIQFDSGVALSVQRPNKLRADRKGDLVSQAFYYDGKALTVYEPGTRQYATVNAPGTLEAMLDFARESLDILAPGSDFVFRNAYDILMTGVTTGFVVGKGVVEGVRCDHLAFRAPHVDWQIWIQDGAQPLPRKIVITSRDVVNMPQFEVVITKWNLAPTFTESVFTFVPPKGANQVALASPVNTSSPKQ
jgi:hypothetical protein